MSEVEKAEKFIKKRVGRNVFDIPPKVSVIIPAYNAAEYISDTLDSVAAQKFREYEIIVVNDGSPDTPQFERAIKLHLENIVYIRQRNAGAGDARNTGIEHARAPLIAFLDADDIWLPDFLTSQYVFLGRNSYDLVYCDAQIFGPKSVYRKTFMEDSPSDGTPDFRSILESRCSILTSGTLARKRAIVDAGMFETERVDAEDFHLWLRMARNGAKMGYQRAELLKYRMHPDGLSGDYINRINRALGAFRRVKETIELDEDETRTVDKRIKGLEADLAVEQGKDFLLKGQFRQAGDAFRLANRYRHSVRLQIIALLTGIAPRTLLNYYKRRGTVDLAVRSTRG